MITVADVMKLPSMYGATILAGHAGMSNHVESVTVLEYGWITNTLDELFSKTEFQGNDLIITSFATIADNVEAQCENIRRYQAMGSVGFILFYIGLILPSVDDRVIACCNELDLGQYRTTATIRITGRPFCKNQLGRPCFCSQERTNSSCQAGPVSQDQIR